MATKKASGGSKGRKTVRKATKKVTRARKAAPRNSAKKAASKKTTRKSVKKAAAKKTTRKPARKAATKKTAPAKTATRKPVKKAAGKAAKRRPARGITPAQALANTRKLLREKQAHDRQAPPWQAIDAGAGQGGQVGYQSAEAAQRAEDLHAGESRMSAIQGSIGTRQRHNQGKRDSR